MDTIVSVTAAAKLGVMKPDIMCWLSSGVVGVGTADDDDDADEDGPAVADSVDATAAPSGWVVSQLDVCCGRGDG